MVFDMSDDNGEGYQDVVRKQWLCLLERRTPWHTKQFFVPIDSISGRVAGWLRLTGVIASMKISSCSLAIHRQEGRSKRPDISKLMTVSRIATQPFDP
jgi:hypothetical protein